MADLRGGLEQKHPNLNLSAEEQRLFAQVFSAADSESIGVVTGDVALRFFPERTKLPSEVLGEIWQIADTEDKGFLTPAGFYIILRLIGYAQAGRPVSAELALKPGGPLPRFEGINTAPNAPVPLQAQGSGGPIRVPPLAADKANQYAALFQQSGAQDGSLPGAVAKQIFDRAQLPNDVLVRIWNLADTEQRGKLSVTEFIIAMHLLASYRGGSLRALPQNLPAGLYEAAARRGTSVRPLSATRDGPPASAIPRQFSGTAPPRTSSPLARQNYNQSVAAQSTGDWLIAPGEKTQYDGEFSKLDVGNQGYVGGEQAVAYFSNSRLPEDDLAQIWDLADIHSEGQLNRDEFAVAMYLIRRQLASKGPVPASLPKNLIPPSMRDSIAQRQPLVPTITSVSSQKPKSAAEDLFGLDAFSASEPSPAPQVPQSTGDSSVTPAPRPQISSPPLSQPVQPSVFKPFVPSSSFGQSINSPQQTGPAQSTSSIQQPKALQTTDDDLLGDTDPEISQRLTQETTELANLSNQVGTLTTQMQEVKHKRASTEQDLSNVGTQKRDFEARLGQLRSAYEQEARDLKTLEDRLNNSRGESRKIQADLAMVQHTLSKLQEQKQQVLMALEADQKENVNLKERMRQVNAEIGQIKPQIEKTRSDARQQKGLVAINKKQLSTNEAERDKAKSDLDAATKEYEEATRELEESNRDIQTSQNVSAVPVASPASPSSTNQTNPFFKRTATASSERGMAQMSFTPEPVTSPNHSAFDNFFGAAFPATGAAGSSTEHPQSSFRALQEPQSSEPPAAIEEKFSAEGTSKTGPTPPFQAVQNDFPSSSQLPPPPPQSRQITSSFLPLRDGLPQDHSPSSSVGVAPPASRFGDTSGYSTPALERQISQPIPQAQNALATASPPLANSEEGEAPGPHQSRSAVSDSASGIHFDNAAIEENAQQHLHAAVSASSQSIPGSFPGDPVSDEIVDPMPGMGTGSAPGSEDPFTIPSSAKTLTSVKDDFDSAFAGMGTKGKEPEQADAFENSFARQGTGAKHEFPPIQEFEGNDSESESEKGFEDDFTGVSSQPGPISREVESTDGASHPIGEPRTEDRPPLSGGLSHGSQLPTPDAQASPPTYENTVSSRTNGDSKDSSRFPAAFTGLLPSRDDPLQLSSVSSPEVAALIPPHEPHVDGTSISEQTKAMVENQASATHQQANQQAPPTPFDDFDNEFGDLAEAQAADDKTDHEFGSQGDNFFEEFNPTFDSPAASKMTSSLAFQDNSFHDFESGLSGPTQSFSAAGSSQAASSHDWDAMFAGLNSGSHTNGNNTSQQAVGPIKPSGSTSETPTKPGLQRTETESDDPILKRLTAMGYPREKSLAALEKFDYNLDKAADFLTSQG